MGKIDVSGKCILVTGGNGYLGRELIKRLIREKAIVYSIDIQNQAFTEKISYIKLDIRNKTELETTLKEINPEIVYHLAALLDREREFENKSEVYEVNLNASINLLNALKSTSCQKLIFTSTSEVYGGDNCIAPFKEIGDFVPASPYSLSKFAAEMAIRSFSNLYKKNYIILRLFNFYSEGMPNKFFLAQLKEKLLEGKDFDMTEGEQLRDFIHINDVVEALILSLNENINNEVFNICTGTGRSIRDIAIQLKKDLKSNININFGALPYRENEIWEMVGDNTKAKKILGFNPTTELKEL